MACLVVLGPVARGDVIAAPNIESVVMPGAVIKKHAKYENDCGKCHVRFDRGAQPRLCLACHDHRDVAGDVRNASGYHGRIKERECRACHTEHKGRDARIAVIDESRFDHAFTDFALREKHADAKCASCHAPNVKRRDAPTECNGCHRKDDKHRGELGSKCESCHGEAGWKPARVDHDKTRFPLRQRHLEAKCAACHPAGRYTDAPRDCVSCHRKDDQHQGQLGTRCERCHDETSWKASSFQHDRDSDFPLRGKHREAKCDSCHRSPGFRDKLPVRCEACHQRDDMRAGHKGAFGARCETCHGGKSWAAIIFDHDLDTRYPLRDSHRAAKCGDCHRLPLYAAKPDDRCVACHGRDDRHDGQLGQECRSCHSERKWRETRFEHDRSPFPLLGKHAQARCSDCHATLAFRDVKAECTSCHGKDDPHRGRYTAECADCHDARGWRLIAYDHNPRGRFKVDGKHTRLACSACHKFPLRDKGEAPLQCADCHKHDDVHFDTYGRQCQRCHVADDWRAIINRDGSKSPSSRRSLPGSR